MSKSNLLNLAGVCKDAEARNQKYTEALDGKNDTATQERDLKDEDIEKMYQELFAPRSEIANIQKSLKIATTVSATATSEMSTLHKTTKSLNVKRLDIPTFCEKIKEYPSFKNVFDDHAVASCKKNFYDLKGCPSREALITVECVDDD